MSDLEATEYALVEPFEFAVRKRDVKMPPPGYVLLKPIVAGICGSEILYFRGEKEKEKLEGRLPMCLLHEGVAQVVDAGKSVKVRNGMCVVVNPMLTCGRCVSCKLRIGENFCQESKYMAATADGLSRTLFLYPEDRIVQVPDGIELEVAALTEPLSIALNAFEVAEVSKKEKVAVIGDGPLGYMMALMASQVGQIHKNSLYLIGIIDEKLDLAKDFSTILNSISEKEKMQRMRQSFEVVFEAVGGQAQETTMDQAIQLLRPRGRCVILGLSGKKVPVNVNNIVNKGLTVKGSVRSRMEHYERVIQLLKDGKFRDKVKRIISRKRFLIRSPEDLEAAFRYADTHEGESRTKPGRVMVYFP